MFGWRGMAIWIPTCARMTNVLPRCLFLCIIFTCHSAQVENQDYFASHECSFNVIPAYAGIQSIWKTHHTGTISINS